MDDCENCKVLEVEIKDLKEKNEALFKALDNGIFDINEVLKEMGKEL